MNIPSSRTVLAGAAALLLGLTSACGDDDDDAAETTSSVAVTAAPAATAAPVATDAPTTDAPAATDAPATTGGGDTATPTGDSEVTTAEAPDLGSILVDAEGMTLYMFVPDEGQDTSQCEADCLATWPALPGPATAGEGADDSLLDTVTRADDGTEQATYNGWPLYYFANDAAAGDVNGQGIGDVWYVLDPDGEPIGRS